MNNTKSTDATITTRRPKGDGSVYQTARGEWRAKIPASIETGNKPKSFSAKTRAEVVKKMNAYKNTLKTGFAPQTEKLVKDYIKYWLYNVKFNTLKPSSFDRLESTILNHIIPQIGEYSLSDITPEIVQINVIEHMQHIPATGNNAKTFSLSYSSIKKAFDALSDMFNYARLSGCIYSNPMELVTMPRKDKFKTSDIVFFTDDEITRFVDTCRLTFRNGAQRYIYGNVFVFMLYTGIRAGEMLSLTWDDIDFKNKYAYIKGNTVSVKDRNKNKFNDEDNNVKLKYVSLQQDTTKTQKSTNREVPINKKALDAIQKLLDTYVKRFGHCPKYIVSKNETESVTFSTLSKSFDKIIDKSDIQKCGLHTLRHTFASLMFRKGIDIRIISEILGHASTSITYNTYIHLVEKQKNDALQAIDDI